MKRIYIRWMAMFGVLAVCALPAAAQIVSVVPLSEQNITDLGRIEAVFNSIHTMSASFVQTTDTEISQGTILLSRPNGLRMEYQDPAPHLLVGRGNTIMYHDRHLLQTTFLPLDRTPASFILQENLRFDETLVITGFVSRGSIRRVTVAQAGNVEAGSITLMFEDQPLRFVGWRVTEQGGGDINIALVEPHYDVPIDEDLFRPIDPKSLR